MHLDKSQFSRYHRELDLMHPSDFHIGKSEQSSRKTIRICCGGNTEAGLRGFTEIFGEESYHVTEEYAVGNSLIGYMDAQLIILFFEDCADYNDWLNSGVELNFLQCSFEVANLSDEGYTEGTGLGGSNITQEQYTPMIYINDGG